MKILRVHNYYRNATPSGENAVYEAENALLRQAGHQLIELTRSNDEIKKSPLQTALEALLLQPWNPASARRLHTAIQKTAPDVIHIHNTFPLLSPSVFWAAHASSVAVVCTVHNYRQFCTAAVAMRDDRPCLQCLEQRSVVPAIRHGCHRGNPVLALPTAATIALHRHLGTWEHTVDRYIALSEIQRQHLVAAGLPADRVVVKPHFVTPPPTIIPWPQRTGGLMFIGRLTREKGVDLLLRALALWRNAPPLEIIGDGDCSEALRRLSENLGLGSRVQFTGLLPRPAALQRLAQARLLVIPSRGWETFGMTAVEAYAYGVPVLAADRGGLAEVVGASRGGRLFQAESVEDLRNQLVTLWSAPDKLSEMACHAARLASERYSPERSLHNLETIYTEAQQAASARHHTGTRMQL